MSTAAGLRTAGRPAFGIGLPGRQWRVPIALIMAIIVAGIVLASLPRQHARLNGYLDPASSSPDGSGALADLLGERGQVVTAAYSPAEALAAIGKPGTAVTATLVVTMPGLLSRRQLRVLATARADLLLVEPRSAALKSLAPQVTVKSTDATAIGPVPAGCSLPAARLAGSADLGGITYRRGRAAAGCYLVGGFPSLVRYPAGGRTITIAGLGAPFTNANLADAGNAALAMNLLSAHDRVVWLTPQPSAASALRPAGARQAQRPTLIPWVAWLVVLQLAVAATLAVMWRARRLGPLIAERLPVVVRASETVEGHARLYQSRRARSRAARALREAMLTRMLPALGLPKGAGPEAVTDALAGHSMQGGPAISAIVFGPAPATDSELMTLARQLDDLEREVRSQ